MKLRINDPVAWNRIVRLYAPLVWHWCRRMKLPVQESADIVQEVFQSVALKFSTFRRDRPGDTFRGWLRTITKNKVLDYFRLRKKAPPAAGGTQAQAWWTRLPDSVSETLADDSEAEPTLLRQALELIQDGFEEKTWRAFWGVVILGRSPQEMAEELGMNPASVRVAKCRVLQRLRRELGDGPE